VIELISIDEIAEWLDQRAMYQEAHLIKRRQDEVAEGPVASTYLALAVAEPVDRYGQRPQVTGSDAMVLPAPAWCHDPTGIEPPTGYAIDQLPALGGASGEPLHSTGIADAGAQVSADREDGPNGR
jgi:hypothetical protein